MCEYQSVFNLQAGAWLFLLLFHKESVVGEKHLVTNRCTISVASQPSESFSRFALWRTVPGGVFVQTHMNIKGMLQRFPKGDTPMSPKWCSRKPKEQGDHSHFRIATDRNGYPIYSSISSFVCHTHLYQQITTSPRKDFRNQSRKDLWVKSPIPLSILGQLYPLSPV